MNTYNVVISVSTTVCIDAESPDDAIEKVSQALNNGDVNMSTDIANNIGYSMRNGHYEVTDAIPMDEDYDEDSGNEEDDESEEWEQHNRREVWYREKELDAHGIPTGRTYKACSCLLCEACGHRETVDNSFDESYK